MRKGDTLGKISHKFGVTIEHLRALNHIQGAMVRPGQILVIRQEEARRPAVAKERAPLKKAAAPPGKAKAASSRTYVLKSGDSLWSVSRQFGVSVAELKAQNRLKGSSVRAGMKLTIPLR